MSFAGRCDGGPLPWTCVASLLIAITEIIKGIIKITSKLDYT